MRRIEILFLACATLGLALGCDDGRDGPDITLMDSGTSSGTDSGTTPTPDSGMTTMPDSGTGDDCPPATVPAPTEATCSADSLTCINDAAAAGGGSISGEQIMMCVSDNHADMAAADACLGCLNTALISCATMGGCDEEWGEIECCLQEACPSGGEACLNSALTGACASQVSTFNSCQQTVSCSIPMECFMSAGGFLPDLDGSPEVQVSPLEAQLVEYFTRYRDPE